MDGVAEDGPWTLDGGNQQGSSGIRRLGVVDGSEENCCGGWRMGLLGGVCTCTCVCK